ncbi:MAG: hypothetical protein F6K31_21805 [Symploca sp. SIO2G7]|nr:hypothetical protein [Symploca sp. SIO2G7]
MNTDNAKELAAGTSVLVLQVAGVSIGAAGAPAILAGVAIAGGLIWLADRHGSK